jgi:hypothetical protein
MHVQAESFNAVIAGSKEDMCKHPPCLLLIAILSPRQILGFILWAQTAVAVHI